MKKIYCIEKQCVEDLDIHNKFNNINLIIIVNSEIV